MKGENDAQYDACGGGITDLPPSTNSHSSTKKPAPSRRACQLALLAGLITLLSASNTLAQRFIVPQDGFFHIESRPVFTFTATLAENWTTPNVGTGTLRVFAPVLPELSSQQGMSSRLFVAGTQIVTASRVADTGGKPRSMLALRIQSETLSSRSGIPLRAEYAGTLFARTLKNGKPQTTVPDLPFDQRIAYLSASATMDYRDPGLQVWMTSQGLRRQTGEQITQFAYRVFTHLIKNGHDGGDTSSYEARRPSRVFRSLTSDCGGLALLFVAVMRTNGIPARTLFGRWAIPQTDAYGQYHVIAEFFVPNSGWVPVDVSGTIVHQPNDPGAFFGNTDGQFVAFHIDPDIEPASGFRHSWAQYLLLQWEGTGDFWKNHRFESKWNVTRNNAFGAK